MKEAIVACRAATPEAVATLVKIMRHGSNETLKLSAANSLLDRGLGRPPQAVELSA